MLGALGGILKKFDKSFGLSGKDYGKVGPDRTMEDIEKRRQDPWNFLFIAGMWFQDLFNYDFRRTEMCIIPYGTQEGEISFPQLLRDLEAGNPRERLVVGESDSAVVRGVFVAEVLGVFGHLQEGEAVERG
mgnify:CR=1 FL=1